MSRDRKRAGRRSRSSIMERFLHGFGTQLGNPQGWPGRVVGWVLTKNNRSINAWIVQLLDIQPADHILEVGCGPGLAIQGFAARAKEGLVAGIDPSPIMVEQARKRNAAAIKAGRVEIQQGEASTLPYPDASFDKVVAVHVIYFWSDAVVTLQELRRVLQPGGVVAIGFLLKEHQPRVTQKAFAQTGATLYSVAEDVAALLAAAGFTQIRVEMQRGFRGRPGCCALGQK